jgi:hypothetical protein
MSSEKVLRLKLPILSLLTQPCHSRRKIWPPLPHLATRFLEGNISFIATADFIGVTMTGEVSDMASIRKTLPTSVSELLGLGRRVVACIRESPHFSQPPPGLATALDNVAAGTEKLQNAESEARVGGSQKKQYRNEVKEEFLHSVKTLARQVDAFADGDANILKASGFEVIEDGPKKAASRSVLRIPVCTVVPGATPGTGVATWKHIPSALSIEAHIAERDPTVPENWKLFGFFPLTSHAEFTGLASGKNVSFRFRALNGTEQGPWSPIHTLTPH